MTLALQVMGGAGAGSWAMGVTAFFCTAITILSFRYGEKAITRSDIFFFSAALLTIPLWIVTKDLAFAAVLVALIDAAAFYPTIRKTWLRPHEEMVHTHALSTMKHVLSLLALSAVNIPTALPVAALVLFNFVLVATIWWRRTALAQLKAMAYAARPAMAGLGVAK